MKTNILLLLILLSLQFSVQAQLTTPDKFQIKKKEELVIQPIKHATMVLSYNNKTIYIDPVGGADLFEGLPDPDMILITDFDKDHYDLRTLESIHTANAIIVVPQAVADRLPDMLIRKRLVVFNNGDMRMLDGVGVAAIPMYTLPESEDGSSNKGRGNGYVIGIAGKNIYISGQTDAIPEMRELKNIDIAFVAMNRPNATAARQVAERVLDFRPGIVYPYDYYGQDVTGFKTFLNEADGKIDVRLKNWYP